MCIGNSRGNALKSLKNIIDMLTRRENGIIYNALLKWQKAEKSGGQKNRNREQGQWIENNNNMINVNQTMSIITLNISSLNTWTKSHRLSGYHFTSIEWLDSKGQEITSMVRIWGVKRNPCALLMGMQIGGAPLENSMDILQKLKMELSYNSVIPLLDAY